ncbi:MAG: GtrA family protein [Desulfobulbaceae bacterium]|nr:GtrA family protein [Desulfobulbaceae bacterium]
MAEYKQSFLQLIRFAIVGLCSNGILYLAYIGLTMLSMGPKTAMSLLYITGVLQTFLFNRRWTFNHLGAARPALIRYLLSYLSGYIINFVALLLFVDIVDLPHQAVQAAMIIFLAFYLFALQKFWVFRKK